MIVLSRKKNEGIIIRDNIVVRVLEIMGDKVRLEFDAPPDVSIKRGEYEKLKERKQAMRAFRESHQTFKGYLEKGRYLKAYDFLEKNEYSPTSEELFKLTKGLAGKLKEYEGKGL